MSSELRRTDPQWRHPPVILLFEEGLRQGREVSTPPGTQRVLGRYRRAGRRRIISGNYTAIGSSNSPFSTRDVSIPAARTVIVYDVSCVRKRVLNIQNACHRRRNAG